MTDTPALEVRDLTKIFGARGGFGFRRGIGRRGRFFVLFLRGVTAGHHVKAPILQIDS